MKYAITTPHDVTVEVETNDQEYLQDLEKRGYRVQRVYNVCTSCES